MLSHPLSVVVKQTPNTQLTALRGATSGTDLKYSTRAEGSGLEAWEPRVYDPA